MPGGKAVIDACPGRHRGRRRCGRHALRLPWLLTLLALGVAGAGRGQEAGAWPEWRLSLKGGPENNHGLELLGPDADQCVRFDPDGLRIQLPPGWNGERPSTGAVAKTVLKGDFEITAHFEVLAEPEQPDTGQVGTRLSLGVFQRLPGGAVATVSRSVGAKAGRVFVTWLSTMNPETGQRSPRGRTFPTTATSGRLRLARTGQALAYYAAGPGEEFQLLHEMPFGAEDVVEIRLMGSTGGPKASLDVRCTDWHVRAESLAPLPGTSPVAASAGEAPPGNVVWLLAAGGIALALVLAWVGVWLARRSARGKPVAPARSPAPGPVRRPARQE